MTNENNILKLTKFCSGETSETEDSNIMREKAHIHTTKQLKRNK